MIHFIKKLLGKTNASVQNKPYDASYFFIHASEEEKNKLIREAAVLANRDQLKLYKEMTSGKVRAKVQ